MRLVASFCVAFILTSTSFAQIVSPTMAQSTFVTPSVQYPTIQSALYAAAASPVAPTVLIVPGAYTGQNLVVLQSIGGMVTIKADKPDTVTLFGGTTGNTLTIYSNALVHLENLNITNEQPRSSNYGVSAISAWGVAGIEVVNCAIYSASIGISSNAAVYTTVTDNSINGLTNDAGYAVGVMLQNQNLLDKNKGARVYNNTFDSLGTGIYQISFIDESATPSLQRCKNNGKRCPDTNTYLLSVTTPFYLTNNIP